MPVPTAPRRLLLLLAAALPLGCITIDLGLGPPPALTESVVHGTEGAKILMIQIDGILTEKAESTLLGVRESRVARLREELDRARDDDEVRAVLVRIDSPGGTVTASDLLYQEIARFKRERGVPVVAQLMGVAASGGYYVAMAADHVRAQPTTVTGSIGVMFGNLSFAGLMEKIGVEDQTLTSGPHKDAGSYLRRMTPEERAHLASVLDDMQERFLAVVAEGRGLDAEAMARVSDGRIFSAPQALEHGLVDAIGGIEDAIAEVRRRADLDEARVVTYHRPREYRDNLYSRAPTAQAGADPTALLRRPAASRPAFLYLWGRGPWDWGGALAPALQ